MIYYNFINLGNSWITLGKVEFSGGSNQIYPPPSVVDNSNTNVLTTQYSGPSDVEIYAGLTSATGLSMISTVISFVVTLPIQNGSLLTVLFLMKASTSACVLP